MNNALRKNDIDALIEKISHQYINIVSLYKSSLENKEVGSSLKIEVKNYFENARSILDYSAHDIANIFEIENKMIYFPITRKYRNKDNFEKCIKKNLPGLKSKNLEIYNYLESIQPFNKEFSWLADFATLNIDSKHIRLTPQVINERAIGFNMKRNNTEFISHGSFFYGDVKIKLNDTIVSIDPSTQFPKETLGVDIKQEKWTSFLFEGSIDVLNLLKNIHDNVPLIIDNIYKILLK